MNYLIYKKITVMKSNIIRSERYVPLNGAELTIARHANLPEEIRDVFDQETGKFVKGVMTKKGMNPLDSFF